MLNDAFSIPGVPLPFTPGYLPCPLPGAMRIWAPKKLAADHNAVSGTSASSISVSTLDTRFSNDPPTLTELETMRQAHNNLVLALRRS